jgi:FMN phosphatase YigB (HAD superfamily)
MPLPVDVFITAANEDIASRAQTIFETIPNVGKLRIATVPNRGRNFGPFLVEFASELLDYDLMCHMHSKKSLYSGREQTQWFDYLHEFLLKDAFTVKSLLTLFEQNQDLGMYYPTSFWMMPNWVNHWTCNKPFAASMLKEFGLNAHSDFLNYPVGGMFWARPKAIAPLLEKTYQYEDFPEEPLPNDGSYLHALERVLGLLTEKQGYEQFFYYPPEGKFTKDKTYMFIQYTKPVRQFFNEVSNFEIVSFDVFDTLVNRKYVAPDFAKYRLGEYLAEHDVVASPELFVKLRNDVETQLRIERNHQGDVKLAEVYDAMAEHLGCDLEQAREWSELEFQFDMHGMSGKTEMIQVLNRLSDLGREIWLITDTYYSEQQISMILRHCGLAITFRLFVSSELGLRKDNTSMWQHIRGLVDASEKSFIHIGDSVRSDAQLCGDFGFANMHILHPKDKWLAAGFGENGVTKGENVKQESMKWGALMSRFGRYPFFGN